MEEATGSCELCGAPVDISDAGYVTGVDFDGRPKRFQLFTVMCAAGHRYMSIGNRALCLRCEHPEDLCECMEEAE